MFERFANVKIKIIDAEFLKTIPLSKVRAYIESKQWVMSQNIFWNSEVKGEIWIHEGSDKAISLPTKQSFLDYPHRLSETLDILSKMENNKNQLVIVEEIFSIEDNS